MAGPIFSSYDSFPQQLLHNLRNGKFEEVGLQAGVAYDEDGHTFAGIGTDRADYDNDGWPDIFVKPLANQCYALFHNMKGAFSYVSGPSGLSPATFAHSGWGARFADFDNEDVSLAGGAIFKTPIAARGVASADE